MKLNMTLAVVALLTMGLSSAYADTVNFTLSLPDAKVPATGTTLLPTTVTFLATVSAPSSNGAAVFLNGDAFNITAPVTLDDSDFFANFPLSLAPGTSFAGDLFTLTIPPNTPFAIYLGTFTLEGGADGSADDPLGTVDFSVGPVPEPSSILLLLTGMAGLALLAGYKGNLRGWVR